MLPRLFTEAAEKFDRAARSAVGAHSACWIHRPAVGHLEVHAGVAGAVLASARHEGGGRWLVDVGGERRWLGCEVQARVALWHAAAVLRVPAIAV